MQDVLSIMGPTSKLLVLSCVCQHGIWCAVTPREYPHFDPMSKTQTLAMKGASAKFQMSTN